MSKLSELASSTDLLLLDFDGTFYKFTDEFLHHCNEASAKAALKLGVKLPLNDALRIAADSYEKHGTSSLIFRQMYDITQHEWHDAYHDELEHHFIEASQITAHELQAWPHKLALLSHSNRTWICNMLTKFSLKDTIRPEHIFALEDVNFNFKTTDETAYRIVMEKMNASPQRSIMVEDSAKNLIAAKGIGMTTVYVKQGALFNYQEHNYIDYVFDDLPEFMRALKS